MAEGWASPNTVVHPECIPQLCIKTWTMHACWPQDQLALYLWSADYGIPLDCNGRELMAGVLVYWGPSLTWRGRAVNAPKRPLV